MAIRKHLKNTLGSILGYKKSPITGNSLYKEIDYSKKVFFFEEINNYEISPEKSSTIKTYFVFNVSQFSKRKISKYISIMLKEAQKFDFCSRIQLEGVCFKKKGKLRKTKYLKVKAETYLPSSDFVAREIKSKMNNRLWKYYGFRHLNTKQKFKKLGRWLLHAAIIMQFSLPLSIMMLNVINKNNISLEEAKKEFKLKDYPISSDTTQEELLCLANYTVHKAVKEQKDSLWRNPVCDDYSIATKEMYDYIVTEARKEELKDKVNIKFGEVKSNDSLWYHVWLEVEKPDTSTSYFETMIHASNNFNLKGCNAINFNPSYWKENYTLGNSKKHGLILPTTESFLIPGGIARPFYTIVTNFDEVLEILEIRWDKIGTWIYDYTNFLKSGKPMP